MSEKIVETKNLFCSEFLRGFKLLKVYPLETINNVISFIIVSGIILFGINKLGNEVQLFGIIFFPVIMALISGPSASIRGDIEIGVFEQVYTSKHTLLTISCIRSLASAALPMVTSVMIGTIIYVFLYKINFSIVPTLILIMMIILLSLELGTLLAGITIIFRKTETILNFINILILIELIIPFIEMNTTAAYLSMTFLPFAGLITYLQQLFSNSTKIDMNIVLLLSAINLISWGALSLIIYNKCLKHAKIIGTIGQY